MWLWIKVAAKYQRSSYLVTCKVNKYEFISFTVIIHPVHVIVFEMLLFNVYLMGLSLMCHHVCSFLDFCPLSRLSEVNPKYKHIESLAVALSGGKLRELDLSHQELDDAGLELITEALSKPDCRLETLR